MKAGTLGSLDFPVLEEEEGLPGIQGSAGNPGTVDTQDFLVLAFPDIRDSAVVPGFLGIAGTPGTQVNLDIADTPVIRAEAGSADSQGSVVRLLQALDIQGTADFRDIRGIRVSVGDQGIQVTPGFRDQPEPQGQAGSQDIQVTQDFAVLLVTVDFRQPVQANQVIQDFVDYLGTADFVDYQGIQDLAGLEDREELHLGYLDQILRPPVDRLWILRD